MFHRINDCRHAPKNFVPYLTSKNPVMLYISRKEHFNAAHKLYNPNLSAEKLEFATNESGKLGDVIKKADVFIGLIAAGEQTGNMSEAFHQLAEHIKWNAQFQRSIKKAIKYPIALLVVMSVVITIINAAEPDARMVIEPLIVVVMLILSIFLAVASAALIAWQPTRVRPLDVLRYE